MWVSYDSLRLSPRRLLDLHSPGTLVFVFVMLCGGAMLHDMTQMFSEMLWTVFC
jgi:hypothetical protein